MSFGPAPDLIRDPCPPPRPRTLLVAAALALAAAAALLPFDRAIVLALHPMRAGPWDAALRLLDEARGLWIAVFAFAAGGAAWILARSPRGRRAALLVALAPLIANRASTMIKALVKRPRPQAPEQAIEGLRVLVRSDGETSFPSNHVATAAALAIALACVLPWRRARWLPLVLIPLMAWDRVALAVHFPSDAAAGTALALATVAALLASMGGRDPDPRRLWQRYERSPFEDGIEDARR